MAPAAAEGTSPTEDGLEERVLSLARALRVAGVPASTPEVTDALSALRVLPLERRETVRASLKTALVKDAVHHQAFDRLFEVYFPRGRAARPEGSEEPPGAGGGEGSDPNRELSEALHENDDERLRGMARDRVERHGDVRPGANVNEDAYVFRSMRGLNLDAIFDNLREQEVEAEGMTALERRIVEEDLTDRIDNFKQMLRDEVFSAFAEGADADELAQRQQQRPPDEVDFLWATESDLERLRTALQPLARKLTRQLAHKRRSSRQGRLDIRRTLRRSLSTGGIPVEPRFRRPVAGKPELVVVCDISGSMRSFAKFTLELTYALATQFQRVRSFVFVDALDEVTDVFDTSGDFATALQRVDGEADVVEVDGQSWYGNSFEQLWRRAGHDFAPRTTVLVIGDARNNYRSAGAEYLRQVHDRVQSVYWLNPEPTAHWNTGDSVMREFVPACDAVVECRNLSQLEQFVSQRL